MLNIEEMFFPKTRSDIRIVQVGVVPGEGGEPFWAVMVFLGLLISANILSLVRLIRARRSRPQAGLIRA